MSPKITEYQKYFDDIHTKLHYLFKFECIRICVFCITSPKVPLLCVLRWDTLNIFCVVRQPLLRSNVMGNCVKNARKRRRTMSHYSKCEDFTLKFAIRNPLLREIPLNWTFLNFHQKLISPSILRKKAL